MRRQSNIRWMIGPLVILAIAASPARAQVATNSESVVFNRSGPRFGALWVSPGIIDEAAKKNVIIRPTLSLFGWQMETPLGNNPGGPQPVSDLVLLGAGLDQGTFIPSASWRSIPARCSATSMAFQPKILRLGSMQFGSIRCNVIRRRRWVTPWSIRARWSPRTSISC